MEPGVEAIGITQLGQVVPHANQGLLHGIFGGGPVMEDEHGGAVETVDDETNKRFECSTVAATRVLDDLMPH